MRSRFAPGAVALALAAALAGCGTPGGSSNDTAEKADKAAKQTVAKPDPSKAGDVTLTVWDQEVRGGQAAQIKQLNQQFQQKYPNVTIKRVAKSFTDLNTTLKLAVSGPKAPDVVEANQGNVVTIKPNPGRVERVVDVSAGQGHVVPTAIAESRGDLYVGQLTPFPLEPGAALDPPRRRARATSARRGSAARRA